MDVGSQSQANPCRNRRGRPGSRRGRKQIPAATTGTLHAHFTHASHTLRRGIAPNSLEWLGKALEVNPLCADVKITRQSHMWPSQFMGGLTNSETKILCIFFKGVGGMGEATKSRLFFFCWRGRVGELLITGSATGAGRVLY